MIALSSNRDSSGGLGSGASQHVGLAVERRDKPINALSLEDGGKFRAAGRHLADRTIQKNVRDQPALATLAHYIIDLDRLTVALDDAALHQEPERSGLLADHLELLSVIAVETVGIDRRDVTPVALGHLLPLRFAQAVPRGTDRQTSH